MFNSNDYNATCATHGLVRSYFYVENGENVTAVCYVCSVEHLKSICGELTLEAKEEASEV